MKQTTQQTPWWSRLFKKADKSTSKGIFDAGKIFSPESTYVITFGSRKRRKRRKFSLNNRLAFKA